MKKSRPASQDYECQNHDAFSVEERAELHASLDRALGDSEAGAGMDAWEFIKQYRARREDELP